MAVLGFPTTYSTRTFPVASSSRIFPLSSPSAGLASLPLTGITLSSLVTRVRERLLSTFWTDEELVLYIAEGLRIWNTLTGYYRERVDLTLASEQIRYSVPDHIEDGMAILRIDTAAAHLNPTDIAELGAFTPSYPSTAATSAPGQWIPISLNLFALYPQASTDYAVTVDYVREAPIPFSLNDYVQLGDEDLAALIDYVTWMARLKEGGKELQDAMPLLQNFLAQAAKYNSGLLESSIYRKMMGLAAGGREPARPDELATVPYRR